MPIDFDGPFPFPAYAQDDAVLLGPIFHPLTLPDLQGRAHRLFLAGLPALARAAVILAMVNKSREVIWGADGRENARRDRPQSGRCAGGPISVLRKPVVIRECDEHGWMQDRADPHPREQALRIAQENPPFDVSPEQAIAAVRDLLGSIGHTWPECPPAWHPPRSADDQLVAMEIFFS
jgi:hypothetical protein